jgi:integrase
VLVQAAGRVDGVGECVVERPKVRAAGERRIFEGEELAETLTASSEPWTTLFRLAGVVGGRESELLGLWWEDLDLRDLDAATIRFAFQVDRDGERVPLKTEESKARLPLPRSTALMLLEHKARTPAPTTPRSFVFGTRNGGPLGQRNVLRAIYRAQERARTPDGLPTFPELFEADQLGHLVVREDGDFVPCKVGLRELRLPTFHALRHGAAMDCDDAEEARDLLRHRNSNVTRAIYRAHFDDRRRELLRARMEPGWKQAPAPVARRRPRGLGPKCLICSWFARRGGSGKTPGAAYKQEVARSSRAPPIPGVTHSSPRGPLVSSTSAPIRLRAPTKPSWSFAAAARWRTYGR